MSTPLEGRSIAILATNGVEEVELVQPRKALEEAGAKTYLISPQNDSIKAWDHDHWSNDYEVDVPLDEATAEDYHNLMLPGGVMNPDKLRLNKKAIQFVASFLHEGKPIAAICHGSWTLIETRELKGRKMTSWPSLKTDLLNAGVNWVDEEVVVDQGLTTSRGPDDIPAFNNKMIEEFAEGVHSGLAPN
jgi:protease I